MQAYKNFIRNMQGHLGNLYIVLADACMMLLHKFSETCKNKLGQLHSGLYRKVHVVFECRLKYAYDRL